MSLPTDVGKEIVDESGQTIREGLKYNPVPFLIFTAIIIIGILYGANLYLGYLNTKDQVSSNDITMTAQNKVLENGFKQLHDDFLKDQELLNKIYGILKYGKKRDYDE